MHDKYRPEQVIQLREKYPGILVLAHPECAAEVCALCDYVGSTKGMMDYVARSNAKQFGMLTEEGLVNRLEAENPDKTFVWPFGVCSYMKKNNLINTLQALVSPRKEQLVEMNEDLAEKARKSLYKMFELTE